MFLPSYAEQQRIAGILNGYTEQIDRLNPHLKALGEGARGNLNATKIKSYPIAIPPLAEQRRIVNAINTFYKETSQLEQALEDRNGEYLRQRDLLIITAN